MDTNLAILVGRLARAPQLRYVNDSAVLQLSLACSQGTSTETIVPVSVWGSEHQLKDLVPLDKGALLIVQGAIRRRTWEGSDGLEIVASDVQLISNSVVPYQVTSGRG